MARDDLIEEKLRQVPGILREHGCDLWLTFVRESASLHDPVLDLILGTNVTWRTALLLDAAGGRTAIVGSLDRAEIEARGHFPSVIPYVDGLPDALRQALDRLAPRSIALNFSVDDESADGLTHGMYLYLHEVLKGTPWVDRLVSSEGIVASLRGRKTPAEVDRIRRACRLTEEILQELSGILRPGMTERDVAAIIEQARQARGVGPAWLDHCPAVFTGPSSAGAHAGPTDRAIEPGHLTNVDFGVRVEGYCSDLQRTWYFLREGEERAPAAVERGFATVRDAIRLAAEHLRPGVEGWTVDAVARRHIVDAGYEEYPHALGHQVGRAAHDGAGLLCPNWERYGRRGRLAVEEGQVYTLEPRLTVAGHGVATIEEIVVVTRSGCEFLSTPQERLFEVGLPWRDRG